MRGDEWVAGTAEGKGGGGDVANKHMRVAEAQWAVSQREGRERRDRCNGERRSARRGLC